MTDAEAVSTFLGTISQEVNNNQLKISVELARSDPEKYKNIPDLLAFLRRTIPTLQGTAISGGGGQKRSVAAAGTSDHAGRGGARGSSRGDKRRRSGRGGGSSRGSEWGKLRKSPDGKSQRSTNLS